MHVAAVQLPGSTGAVGGQCLPYVLVMRGVRSVVPRLSMLATLSHQGDASHKMFHANIAHAPRTPQDDDDDDDDSEDEKDK
jgi:hypothetical protein